MSGIHLLLALATLGVDVRWDRTPTNELVYAIAIEPELVTSMRDGQAVTGSIPESVKDLRYFRISVEAPSSRLPTSTTHILQPKLIRPETQVDYGWRAADGGGVEYLVQIRPERLRSLVDGQAIEAEINPAAGEVRRFYVFVGVGDLPRDRYSTSGSTVGSDRLSGTNERFADNRLGSGGRSFTTSGTRPNDDYRPSIRRNQGFYDDDDRPPPFASDDRRGTLLTADSPRRNSSSTYEDYSSHYPPTRPTSDRVTQFTQDHSPTSHDYQPMSNRTALPTSQRSEAPPSNAVAWQNSAINQPAPGAGFSGAAGALGSTATRPWAPLIMTTLGLFVSIATNTYLGWLAWTYFWRYREAATELARSRSDVLGSRQAA